MYEESTVPEGTKIKDQRIAGIKKDRRQDHCKSRDTELDGITKNLPNNLRASAKGVNMPRRLGLLGPFRSII